MKKTIVFMGILISGIVILCLPLSAHDIAMEHTHIGDGILTTGQPEPSSPAALATTDKPKVKEVTYEVTITIKHNKVSKEKAAYLASQILTNHGDKACTVEVVIKKGDEDSSITAITGTDTLGWIDHTMTLETDLRVK